MLGICIVFGAALFVAVLLPRNAGLAGLALTSALNLTGRSPLATAHSFTCLHFAAWLSSSCQALNTFYQAATANESHLSQSMLLHGCHASSGRLGVQTKQFGGCTIPHVSRLHAMSLRLRPASQQGAYMIYIFSHLGGY